MREQLNGSTLDSSIGTEEVATALLHPFLVFGGSELCYLPTLMLPEPLPRICSEVGLQDSVQAFGVVQQDLVLRDVIRFDGKGFVVVEGVPATFEENAAAAGNNGRVGL